MGKNQAWSRGRSKSERKTWPRGFILFSSWKEKQDQGNNLGMVYSCLVGFPAGASGKEPICQCRRCKRCGAITGLGKSPRGGNGNPLQNYCLENPVDRGAWQAIAHGVTQRIRHNWSNLACIVVWYLALGDLGKGKYWLSCVKVRYRRWFGIKRIDSRVWNMIFAC